MTVTIRSRINRVAYSLAILQSSPIAPISVMKFDINALPVTLRSALRIKSIYFLQHQVFSTDACVFEIYFFWVSKSYIQFEFIHEKLIECYNVKYSAFGWCTIIAAVD